MSTSMYTLRERASHRIIAPLFSSIFYTLPSLIWLGLQVSLSCCLYALGFARCYLYTLCKPLWERLMSDDAHHQSTWCHATEETQRARLSGWCIIKGLTNLVGFEKSQMFESAYTARAARALVRTSQQLSDRNCQLSRYCSQHSIPIELFYHRLPSWMKSERG